MFFSSDVRGAWAPDHPWGTTREEFERELEAVEHGWGNGTYARLLTAELAPSLASDEDFLTTTLDTDEGARRLGEFGIGCNEGIDRAYGNAVFRWKRAFRKCTCTGFVKVIAVSFIITTPRHC